MYKLCYSYVQGKLHPVAALSHFYILLHLSHTHTHAFARTHAYIYNISRAVSHTHAYKYVGGYL